MTLRPEDEGRPGVPGRPSSRPTSPEAEEGWDPLDQALAAYRAGDADATLVMRTDVGGAEDVPVALFFRTPADMGAVETTALSLARGRVLDLGSGPGAHAVPLARQGLSVTAAEVLAHAREALREGGLADVRAGGLETLSADDRFDTILVLMNGLGLPGTLDALAPFLRRLRDALSVGGQILADSTDPREWDDPDDGRYPGEVHMQLGFRGRWGAPFPFLFVDEDALARAAAAEGLETAVAAREEGGRYLARLTLAQRPPAP